MAKNRTAPEPQSLADLQAAAEAAHNTPRHTFTFPPSLQKETGYVSVTMRELTGHDELVAAGASGASMTSGSQLAGAASIAKELAQLSLVEIERAAGTTKVDAHNAATVFGDMPPKVRNLVLGAYGEIHNPRGDEVESFFASRSVRV